MKVRPKEKHVVVSPETHSRLKVLAALHNCTIRQYMEMLAQSQPLTTA